MVTYTLATDEQLYLASVALASLMVCGAALVAVRLLHRRSAALRHGLLLCALSLCAVSPLRDRCSLDLSMGMGAGSERSPPLDRKEIRRAYLARGA